MAAAEAMRSDSGGNEVGPAAFGVHAYVIGDDEHDGLDFFPVNGTGAVVGEGTPVVGALVAAEVIDAGAGVGMDLLDAFGVGSGAECVAGRLDLHTREDMKLC